MIWPKKLSLTGERFGRSYRAAGARWLIAALLFVIPGATPALAAEIESDRPELTESAKLVPRGAVQMESGVAYSRERRAGRATEKTFEAGADFRIGVTRSVELNLGWDPLVRVREAPRTTLASATSPLECGIASSRASRMCRGRLTSR